MLKRGGEITEYDLDPKFLGGPVTGAAGVGREAGGALARQPFSKEENEKRLLRQALVEARGNRTKAAQLMGISRRTLHRKLVEWPGLDVAG